ncbi:probable TVP15 Tlg2-Vesicle Protein [Rhynchosporium agropyri]|uniref:Probable TVP15 Tlg2-Vesicle Protein n=3 Tax=Rhynchosporium TaxID=38037 RepID=A0A1E1LZE3_RHYSE|nr:probable TVP15 Tlg2-Vesicle Protein [Rhynchosporium agropyri]CZS99943.1 probable TVP15 Tlg2-Vesicle Protein [Rhynchosporium commune]CZT42234.1 probable TVP15 Tlg2-Vesicle Protein [Rhynchosporium secalis]
MDFSDIFRIVNLAVGALMVVGGGFHFKLAISAIIITIYTIIFGLTTALLEFQIPPQVARYASFLFSFIGRGVFYIFVGSLLLSDDGWIRPLFGIIIALVGIGYVVLEFVPSIEPPQNMREADGGWGAEQV